MDQKDDIKKDIGTMRRTFLRQLTAIPALAVLGATSLPFETGAQEKIKRAGGSKLKIGLNAYSFNSEWSGLILDTGSFRAADPYAEIAAAAPYAVNWQIKENIFINADQVKVDLGKLMKVIHASGYRGYLPIETLGAGDPKVNRKEESYEISPSISALRS